MTLYEITMQMQELINIFEADEIEEDVWKDTMESLHGDLEEKAQDYCKVIKMFEGKAQVAEAEMRRLAELKERAESNVKRLRKALLDSMLITGTKKLDAGLFQLSLRNNAMSLGALPSIDDIPMEYHIKQEDKIDKKLLLADIKGGKVIEGVELKQSQSLIIK